MFQTAPSFVSFTVIFIFSRSIAFGVADLAGGLAQQEAGVAPHPQAGGLELLLDAAPERLGPRAPLAQVGRAQAEDFAFFCGLAHEGGDLVEGRLVIFAMHEGVGAESDDALFRNQRRQRLAHVFQRQQRGARELGRRGAAGMLGQQGIFDRS